MDCAKRTRTVDLIRATYYAQILPEPRVKHVEHPSKEDIEGYYVDKQDTELFFGDYVVHRVKLEHCIAIRELKGVKLIDGVKFVEPEIRKGGQSKQMRAMHSGKKEQLPTHIKRRKM